MLQHYLMVQGRGQLKHSSHIVNADVEATCQHFKPWCILKETTELAGPFGTMPQEPWHPGIGAQLDHVIQLTVGKCAPMQVLKTTRTWENFSNQGTKMTLLSDKLWSVVNNSKSFVHRSKSIIRNNLGFHKCSDIYLI